MVPHSGKAVYKDVSISLLKGTSTIAHTVWSSKIYRIILLDTIKKSYIAVFQLEGSQSI